MIPYSGAVYDVIKTMIGYDKPFVLPRELVPISSGICTHIFGPAYTVRGRKMSSRDKWISSKILDDIVNYRGCVYLLQANDNSRAHIGDIGARILKRNGCRGAVVQGWARDSMYLNIIGFPVWAKGVQPQDSGDIWGIYDYKCEIVIGNIFITPDDWIFADVDGVLVVKNEILDDVHKLLPEKLKLEEEQRNMVMYNYTATEIKKKLGRW